MIRLRSLKVIAMLAALLAMALVVVVSSSSHETELEQEAPLTDDPGPKPTEPVPMPRGLVGVELTLALGETEPREWAGDVQVSDGRVAELKVVRSGFAVEVEDGHFSVGTAAVPKKGANKKAANKKNPNKKATNKKNPNKKQQAKAQAKKKQAAAAGVALLAVLDAPASAKVTVKVADDEFSFTPAELPSGRRKAFLDGKAAAERQTAAVRLTGAGTEDDYPAAAKGSDGSVWLVDVAYTPSQPRPLGALKPEEFDILAPKNNGDRIRLRKFDGKAWQPAVDVTEGGLDVWRPTVAVDGKGVIWIAWAQQRDGDWEIYRRTYTPPAAGAEQGTWSDVVRVTNAPGSDFHVVAATDAKGVVWLAWQAWREDNYNIWVSAQQEGHAWNSPRALSDSPANDWGPAIAADAKGNVYVAWDTYDQGNYDVRLATLGEGAPRTRTVAASARFEGRPHLACDKDGRLWIAYEEGDEQWGKDYAHAGPVRNVGLEKNPGFALYVNRTVRVKCLAGDALMLPAGDLERAFDDQPKHNKSVPRLAAAADGGIWLFFRHHPGPTNAGEVWVGSATRYDGRAWSPARRLADSSNIIDNRPALMALEGGLLAVYSSDSRNDTTNRKQDDLYAAFLASDGPATQAPALVADARAPAAELATVHPNEPADVARIRAYRVESAGKSLRLLRGEFHRHTEFSSHNDQDGLLEDAWRYAQDAARLDWMGDGDHDNGFGHEYMWWLIQKTADLHHNAPRFVPAQTYERSVVYPNGHRNVMMPRRGIRPLPRGELRGTAEGGSPDTKVLYAYLKHFGGICASHTSATGMGTDWRDNDPEVEPVVEIFQGHRHNYEHLGAPKSATQQTQIGGFEPAGFIWNALGRGYRLGFQSSSDHVSTHMSYAIVLVEEVSRQGIIDAFKKRHCYAANDNIILDVRSGDHLMGDTFETAEKPKLSIAVQGTAPILKVHVIRDNTYVFSTEPKQNQVTLNYTDDNAESGRPHYYYVRIEQADRNLAWSSPMWITYKK